MRSSRSGPDPLDPGPRGFAHRGLHRAPAIIENSLAAATSALEFGAGMEVDLRLTADNLILVFHDRDTERLCGEKLVVSDAPFSFLRELRFCDGPIPSLGELLAAVSGRVSLLLEAKIDRNLWRFGRALVTFLKDYPGPLGVMSFDPRVSRWLKTNAPHIRRGLVVSDTLSPLRRWLWLKLADPQFLAVDVRAITKPWVADARRRMPIYCWTVRTPADRETARVHADAAIWETDGRP